MPNAPQPAAPEIIRPLRGRGHQAYLVGGCVRDLLLGREPADYDVATDASPEHVMRIFPETYAVGAQFGVVLVPAPKLQRGGVGLTEDAAENPCGFEKAVSDTLNDEPRTESAAHGHSHKSCVEVATFRCDVGYSDGRHPDEVRFSR